MLRVWASDHHTAAYARGSTDARGAGAVPRCASATTVEGSEQAQRFFAPSAFFLHFLVVKRKQGWYNIIMLDDVTLTTKGNDDA